MKIVLIQFLFSPVKASISVKLYFISGVMKLCDKVILIQETEITKQKFYDTSKSKKIKSLNWYSMR